MLASSKFALVTSTVIAALFAFAQSNVIALPYVLTWLSLIIIIAVVRAVHVQSCLRTPLNEQSNVEAQLVKFRLLTVVAGLIWGSAGFYCFRLIILNIKCF